MKLGLSSLRTQINLLGGGEIDNSPLVRLGPPSGLSCAETGPRVRRVVGVATVMPRKDVEILLTFEPGFTAGLLHCLIRVGDDLPEVGGFHAIDIGRLFVRPGEGVLGLKDHSQVCIRSCKKDLHISLRFI